MACRSRMNACSVSSYMSAVYFYPVLEVSVIIGPSLLARYSDMFLPMLLIERRDIKETFSCLGWKPSGRVSLQNESVQWRASQVLMHCPGTPCSLCPFLSEQLLAAQACNCEVHSGFEKFVPSKYCPLIAWHCTNLFLFF